MDFTPTITKARDTQGWFGSLVLLIGLLKSQRGNYAFRSPPLSPSPTQKPATTYSGSFSRTLHLILGLLPRLILEFSND